MEQARLVGAKAGSLKYDILTALAVYGLHGSQTLQTSMIRLSAIVTARYNWRLDEITIGHAELARLWAVNDRTVKREMKRLVSGGFLNCLRPGVRGRVGAYRLNYASIYEQTHLIWAEIGSDFVERMTEIAGLRKVVQVNFKPTPVEISHDAKEAGTWGSVRRRLKAQDEAAFESWFAKLVQESIDDETLVLRAPNSFVARYIEVHFSKQLTEAVDLEMPTPSKRSRRIELITTD